MTDEDQSTPLSHFDSHNQTLEILELSECLLAQKKRQAELLQCPESADWRAFSENLMTLTEQALSMCEELAGQAADGAILLTLLDQALGEKTDFAEYQQALNDLKKQSEGVAA